MLAFYADTVAKVLTGVVIVVAYLNVTGRNQIAQMTAIDLVGNFILGGVISGVLYNRDVTFLQFLALLLICILVLAVVNYLARHRVRLRAASIGRPIPIIENGRFVIESFEAHRTRLDIDDLATALRMQGIFSFEGVSFAQLEPTGHLSVIRETGMNPSRFMVFRGAILKNELHESGFTEAWVQEELREAGVERIADVFLAEWCHDHMMIVLNDGRMRAGSQRTARSVNASRLPVKGEAGQDGTTAAAPWAGSGR
jgi:uncharacterized membrane protein YcaP (DUF421 family)